MVGVAGSFVTCATASYFCISENQPFVDGNKRTALASCLNFLKITVTAFSAFSKDAKLPKQPTDIDRDYVATAARDGWGRALEAISMKIWCTKHGTRVTEVPAAYVSIGSARKQARGRGPKSR